MIKKYIKRKNFFYKLFLYYRLIYKEKFFINRRTYSQSGEDIFIIKFMKKKKIIKGTYVDIGAFHPIKYSNTCLLFKSGWSGINIDLNQTAIDYFNILRPNDKNICCAISNIEKKTKVYIKSIFSPLNSISKKHATDLNFAKKNSQSYLVKTQKFNSLIKKNFDFLNIDIEGLDFAVLKSINFKFYTPKLICVEILKKKNLEIIKSYLKKYNYFYAQKNTTSYFFELK
jgi:hypothetical protein|tara:strand:- start:973 stop:1656 length:684 start_codon:yes stop_codon:yes gene_type:complete